MSEALRTMAERHLVTPCTVSSVANVSDGAGGFIRTPTIRENTRCRIEVIGSSADVPDTIKERIGARQPYRFSLPHDSAAVPGDFLATDAATFEVMTAPRPTTAVLVSGLCVGV